MNHIAFALAFLLAPAANAQTLSDLAWLKGCWRTQGDGPSITKVWLAPPMPAMLGYSYTLRDGAIRGWEQTRIEMIDGWPHFVAMPGGGAPVRINEVVSPAMNPKYADHGIKGSKGGSSSFWRSRAR